MPEELHTWKDVANYLGVSVRTAQSWELRRGLPVRRLPGEKARVLAITSEIDDWKLGATEPLPTRPTLAGPRMLAVAALIVGICIGGAAMTYFNSPGPLHHFTLMNGVLQAFDSRGRPTWAQQVSGRGLEPAPMWLPSATQADLDGDGNPELIAIDRSGSGSHVVVCFDSRGRMLWSRELGRTIRTSRTYEPPYHSRGLRILQGFPDQKPRILATAFHNTFHPTQLLVLDNRGGVLGEYWHSGHLGAFALYDWDGDGRMELLAGGVNQAARTAELVILDLESMNGTSNAGDEAYQIRDMAIGVEKARAQFSRTQVSRDSSPYNFIDHIQTKSSTIVVGVAENTSLTEFSHSLFFEIGRDREVVAVSASDYYRVHHSTRVRAGLPAGPLTPEELKAQLPVRWFPKLPN